MFQIKVQRCGDVPTLVHTSINSYTVIHNGEKHTKRQIVSRNLIFSESDGRNMISLHD